MVAEGSLNPGLCSSRIPNVQLPLTRVGVGEDGVTLCICPPQEELRGNGVDFASAFSASPAGAPFARTGDVGKENHSQRSAHFYD